MQHGSLTYYEVTKFQLIFTRPYFKEHSGFSFDVYNLFVDILSTSLKWNINNNIIAMGEIVAFWHLNLFWGDGRRGSGWVLSDRDNAVESVAHL